MSPLMLHLASDGSSSGAMLADREAVADDQLQ